MAKFFAWLLFLFSTALFVVSFVHERTLAEYEDQCNKMAQPLPDMVRFQQACAADQD